MMEPKPDVLEMSHKIDKLEAKVKRISLSLVNTTQTSAELWAMERGRDGELLRPDFYNLISPQEDIISAELDWKVENVYEREKEYYRKLEEEQHEY